MPRSIAMRLFSSPSVHREDSRTIVSGDTFRKPIRAARTIFQPHVLLGPAAGIGWSQTAKKGAHVTNVKQGLFAIRLLTATSTKSKPKSRCCRRFTKRTSSKWKRPPK
eukprot:gnl/TRDRNA2_/TRDRNA2_53286_c0_seq1.p1 gnl/TRDRNA2_/TRDRNA2_53286_c0~~gnl/TRDRNA2_/TRDRNA2_53286_c0_seq1.p1  ORF type:complete len:108 (+),score=4.01 gnl/TRDRNA2_/TRDRNA2_53286_c0_seq1:454-777(+)